MVSRNPHIGRRLHRGTCYLLHFSRPLAHARHYLGFVAGDAAAVAERVAVHMAGRGARLMAAVAAAGITAQVVRLWERTDRHHERRLKRWKMGPRLCPLCQAHRS